MWSVGCVLAELLLRRPVFEGEDAAVDTFDDLRPAEDEAERRMAFAMGLHERLGAESRARVLNSNADVLQVILDHTLGPTAHAIAVLQSQLSVLGSPTDEEYQALGPRAKETISGLSPQPGRGWKDLFAAANLNPLALNLLRSMLSFDPSNRPTASEAFGHPYLAKLHDPQDNPSFDKDVDLRAEHAACVAESVEQVHARLEAIAAQDSQQRV